MMTRNLTLALLLAAALPALAQDMPAVDPALDTSGDGLYSFPEMQAAWPDLTEAGFSAIDTSGDGLIEMAEVAAALAAGLWPATGG